MNILSEASGDFSWSEISDNIISLKNVEMDFLRVKNLLKKYKYI